MYYPMRSIRTHQFHLIHNLHFRMPFMIDQDFFVSPTFQDLLNRTRLGLPLHWYKTLKEYYYRPQWELYDIRSDPREEVNLAGKQQFVEIFKSLRIQLNFWQNITADPWICAPGGVLEYQGKHKAHPVCLSLENGLKNEL
ncbi:N-sulphoglucosamine sulphohydrolase-like [Plakobranchus ocellatus]|uniref:N-sulphoglucosamine sulphohydrolase-like n=1 Tax=Plakobranchus ocellatus TaxID=259542 RepID=A0AAV4CIR4_9GAST|nr:N-sulphoglucosamine sulphohydrolase-like [Plakobranchus ocellatus]